jgi:hypothetical protein
MASGEAPSQNRTPALGLVCIFRYIAEPRICQLALMNVRF